MDSAVLYIFLHHELWLVSTREFANRWWFCILPYAERQLRLTLSASVRVSNWPALGRHRCSGTERPACIGRSAGSACVRTAQPQTDGGDSAAATAGAQPPRHRAARLSRANICSLFRYHPQKTTTGEFIIRTYGACWWMVMPSPPQPLTFL